MPRICHINEFIPWTVPHFKTWMCFVSIFDTSCEHVQRRSWGHLLHHWAAQMSWLLLIQKAPDSPRPASPQSPAWETIHWICCTYAGLQLPLRTTLTSRPGVGLNNFELLSPNEKLRLYLYLKSHLVFHSCWEIINFQGLFLKDFLHSNMH